MWQIIAQADTVEGLSSTVPTVSELSKGTELIIRFDLPAWAPIGTLADVAGAEWWGQWLVGAGMEVTDIYGSWHWMEIKGKADPIFLVILLPLIIKAVAALGIAGFLSWASVKLTANIFVKPAEISYEREQAKIKFIEKMAPIYGADTVTRWLEGIESPPPGIDLPEWLPAAGLGIGTLLLIGLGVFLISRK